MRMKRSWAPTIRVLWFSTAILLAALAAAPQACAQTATPDALQRLAASYRANPNVKDRAALLHYAAAHSRKVDGALARLALVRGEISQGRAQDVQAQLDSAAPYLR